jgi:negative regulator of flagellin synthesis FlgM
MSIERTAQLRPVAAAQQDSTTRQRSVTSQISSFAFNSDSAAQVKLSQLTQQVRTDTSQDINVDRVNELKAQIAEGRLTMDTHLIASRLVDNMFDF